MADDYGFRISGDVSQERKLIAWPSAFAAYCACDDRAEVNREAYLSAFMFGSAFRRHLDSTGSTKGYSGPCWASWLWLDIDREGDLATATSDARRLVAAICQRFALEGDDLLIFFSGSKGFHVGVPTSLWQPQAGDDFHRVARQFARRIAQGAGIAIDSGVYDRVRAFRAPNSRHGKTGRHKRPLTFEELMYLKPEAIVGLTADPVEFDVPVPPACSELAAADWQIAIDEVAKQAEVAGLRRQVTGGKVNRGTLEFIREGATVGDRHRMLFSAAANLAECGCPLALAEQLLIESALDSGLPPRDVKRQIECGFNHGR